MVAVPEPIINTLVIGYAKVFLSPVSSFTIFQVIVIAPNNKVLLDSKNAEPSFSFDLTAFTLKYLLFLEEHDEGMQIKFLCKSVHSKIEISKYMKKIIKR